MKKKFWLLTIASALSKIGNSFLYLAIPYVILEQTHSSFLAILSIGIQSLPYILSPFIGILIDRYDKKLLFALSEFAQAICVAVIPLLLMSNTTAGIFMMLILLGLGNVISSITSDFGLIPKIIDNNNIELAYSRYSTIQNFARLVGPVIAGFVIAYLGSYIALWIDASTFLITMLASLLLKVPKEPSSSNGLVISDLKSGFMKFWSNREIRILTLSLMLYNIGTGSLYAMLLTVSNELWNYNANIFGTIMGMAALAGAVGSWISGNAFLSQNIKVRISIWYFLCIVGTLFLIVNNQFILITGYFVIVFAEGGLNVQTMSYRQKNINPQYVGRINSIIRMFVMSAIPISSVVFGLLTEKVNDINITMLFLPVFVFASISLIIWSSKILYIKKTNSKNIMN